jgi:hypothetical protein
VAPPAFSSTAAVMRRARHRPPPGSRRRSRPPWATAMRRTQVGGDAVRTSGAAGDHHDLSRAAALEQRQQGGGSDRSGPDHTHLPSASAVAGGGPRRQDAGSSARVAALRVAGPERAVVHGRRPDPGCRVRRTGRAGRLGTKNSVPATAVEKSRIRSCAAGGPVRLVAGRHDTAQPFHDLGSQRAGQFQSDGPDALDCPGAAVEGSPCRARPHRRGPSWRCCPRAVRDGSRHERRPQARPGPQRPCGARNHSAAGRCR